MIEPDGPMNTVPSALPATVYLVGAGPGAAGLITVRGMECLEQADLVLYDYLVNPAVLEHASPSAELVGLGHHTTGRALPTDEITAQMLDAARRGKVVVRLKSGDPLVFGRGGDEAQALREAGIPFEIVPGITAALAVAAFCEIPITHHDDASAVALITGRERHDKQEPHLNYRVLAEFPGTLIIYMGVRSAEQWSRALIRHGKPPDTPVAIVRWCTHAQQQTVRCTLETVAEAVGRCGVQPPALCVVGKVVDRTPRLTWFAARPLSATRILIAGSAGSAQALRDRLALLGADLITQPAVRITEPRDWASADASLDRIDEYDWIVFASGNGVDYLCRRLFDRGMDVRRLGCVKVAAFGRGTADRLMRYHVKADLFTDRSSADALSQALVREAQGKRFLLARGGRVRPKLTQTLVDAGARVDVITVYESVDVEQPSPDVAVALTSGEIDWITVTSSATARSLVNLYGSALRHAHIASISPLTSTALRDLGYEPALEASPHTADALVDAILATCPKQACPDSHDKPE